MPKLNPVILLLSSILLTGCVTNSEQAESLSGEEARLIKLAQDIERRGDKDTAAALYARAATVSGDPVGAHVRLGEARLAAGEPGQAAAAFRTALETSPNDGRALLGLGTAQLHANQVESASRTLAAAAPVVKTASAYNRLGTARVLSGDGAGAEAAFMQAQGIDPANLDTQSNLGLAQALAGKTDTAVATLKRVTESPRAQERHYRNLMLALSLGGRDKEAAAVIVPDYPQSEKTAFLAEARKVRSLKSPQARAKAIGLLASG